jgi:hypothetical protein
MIVAHEAQWFNTCRVDGSHWHNRPFDGHNSPCAAKFQTADKGGSLQFQYQATARWFVYV